MCFHIIESVYNWVERQVDRFIDHMATTFGYISKKEYDDLCIKYDALKHSHHLAKERIAALKFETMETLNEVNKELSAENDRLQAEIVEAEKYFNEVQRQLSEGMHTDPVFGFAGSRAIPGATIVRPISTIGDVITVAGRTIFDDAITAKINNNPNISEKYWIAINSLTRLGIIEKIADNLLQCGAIQFTLAFNPDCTTSELYYKIDAQRAETTFNIKNKTERD